ncbi:hydrolase [Xanthomonas phage Xoo-sp13]|nr:hydrolase [Xanthomonas phage Xoo-sp13]
MTTSGRIAVLIAALAAASCSFLHKKSQDEVIDISHIKPITEVILVDASDFLVKIDPVEYDCMRTNMYYEARNQRTDTAYIAVGYTVLNRTASKRYPNTVCGVVTQARRDIKGNPIRHKCQFSWYCDGKSNKPRLDNVIEQRAWDRASLLALKVMRKEVDNPIGSATMYHANYVKPFWKDSYRQVAVIESHIFYTKPTKA